ncbi:MAG: chorismate synthase [Ruminococcaceae bacterium]|nr:chorismate synthase [Oscillospiraceae bacterium]
MSSQFGKRLKVSVFGQSHGDAIGVVVDGLPAGFAVDEAALARFMARRAPGGTLTTPRSEADTPHFLSGLVDGVTCGAPLCAVIQNTNTRSGDYAALADQPRPSHADYPAAVKYHGFADLRGGGHFSGRLTAPLCVAGGIACQILQKNGISVGAHVASVGNVHDRLFDPVAVTADDLALPASRTPAVLDPSAGEAMAALITDTANRGDSIGGVVECAAVGLPAGLGAPLYDGVENRLAAALFGIPAVKGVEFGAGFAAAAMLGSEHNDAYRREGMGVVTATNHAGGILGGITTGMPLVVRVAFKPTPSIAQPQTTLRLSSGETDTLSIHGRHDPCVALRAVPVVEAVTALTVLDMLLEEKGEITV